MNHYILLAKIKDKSESVKQRVNHLRGFLTPIYQFYLLKINFVVWIID